MERVRNRVAAAILAGLIVSMSSYDLIYFPLQKPPSETGSRHLGLRRSLSIWRSDYRKNRSVNPMFQDRIKPLTSTPDPEKETVIFWHIPKSGGTTLKSLYKCMRQALAVRVGVDPRYGHQDDKEVMAFEPGNMGALFVNVDTLSREGILRAKKMGLVPSGKADLIVTSGALGFAIEHLYDRSYKGRVVALFRNPVERLISKFYYSQVATWERSYRPEWKDIDIEYWAVHINRENDMMVKTLAGLGLEDEVTEADLRIAIKTLRQLFIIGLMSQMEESIHRFNIFMGIDESDENMKMCMDEYFGHGVRKENSNPHPKVKEGSPGWQILAEKNSFDLRLYESIVVLFDEQKEIISSYAKSVAGPKGVE
mmetsp:Transcript_28988/g.61272  ORF Transcript_28988/g.61272 Transcript_28988/m.61272 type:complete len:367 (+) Transcript_28988:35-1135(+)